MKVILKTAAKRIYRRIWGHFMDEYPRALDQIISSDCHTLLDVGCGEHSPLSHVASRMKHTLGVDAHAPALEASRIAGVHTEHVCADALDLLSHFQPNSFDCVAATDLIEHLEKEDGWRLLDAMETIASKKVVIFTPNGFLPQSSYDGNDYQIHRSGWSVEEMQKRGYEVFGLNGWKPLRGERALMRWRPRLFWEPISFLTQPLVVSRPQRAFNFCASRLCRSNLELNAFFQYEFCDLPHPRRWPRYAPSLRLARFAQADGAGAQSSVSGVLAGRFKKVRH